MSLTKVGFRPKESGFDVTNGEVAGAQRKVDALQRELDQITRRVNDVNRRLLEHNAGVLSRAFALDSKNLTVEGEGASLSGDDQSSAASSSSVATSAAPTPFGSSHFYAGHSNANQPASTDNQLSALRAALDAAKKREIQLERDLKHAELEKLERETMLSMDLQAAEETIQSLSAEASRAAGLEGQVLELLDQRDIWRERLLYSSKP